MLVPGARGSPDRGPTIAAMAAPALAKAVAAALPSSGQARVLNLDHQGAVIDRG